MRRSSRKTTPRVRDGKVQRKNRTDLSPHYEQTYQSYPQIDRQRPGTGYRHFLKKWDIHRFIDILPDWHELSRGLDAIVLMPGDDDALGWHRPGIVGVCAWEREMARRWDASFVAEHEMLLDRLGVARERTQNGILCHFSEASVRGFQLMHILLHELGHHHDRMTTRSKDDAARGEGYAEEYALKYADRIWESFLRKFRWY